MRSKTWKCSFRKGALPVTQITFLKPVGKRAARDFLRGLLQQTRQLKRLPYGTQVVAE